MCGSLLHRNKANTALISFNSYLFYFVIQYKNPVNTVEWYLYQFCSLNETQPRNSQAVGDKYAWKCAPLPPPKSEHLRNYKKSCI